MVLGCNVRYSSVNKEQWLPLRRSRAGGYTLRPHPYKWCKECCIVSNIKNIYTNKT